MTDTPVARKKGVGWHSCHLFLFVLVALPPSLPCLVSEKKRRAPSRHCRDARVYGHMTTAMHDASTPSPVVIASILFLALFVLYKKRLPHSMCLHSSSRMADHHTATCHAAAVVANSFVHR